MKKLSLLLLAVLLCTVRVEASFEAGEGGKQDSNHSERNGSRDTTAKNSDQARTDAGRQQSSLTTPRNKVDAKSDEDPPDTLQNNTTPLSTDLKNSHSSAPGHNDPPISPVNLFSSPLHLNGASSISGTLHQRGIVSSIETRAHQPTIASHQQIYLTTYDNFTAQDCRTLLERESELSDQSREIIDCCEAALKNLEVLNMDTMDYLADMQKYYCVDAAYCSYYAAIKLSLIREANNSQPISRNFTEETLETQQTLKIINFYKYCADKFTSFGFSQKINSLTVNYLGNAAEILFNILPTIEDDPTNGGIIQDYITAVDSYIAAEEECLDNGSESLKFSQLKIKAELFKLSAEAKRAGHTSSSLGLFYISEAIKLNKQEEGLLNITGYDPVEVSFYSWQAFCYSLLGKELLKESQNQSAIKKFKAAIDDFKLGLQYFSNNRDAAFSQFDEGVKNAREGKDLSSTTPSPNGDNLTPLDAPFQTISNTTASQLGGKKNERHNDMPLSRFMTPQRSLESESENRSIEPRLDWQSALEECNMRCTIN